MHELSDAVKVAIISGVFALLAIPTGLVLKRLFDLQDRREADEAKDRREADADRRECIRHRLAYQLAVEQLRSVAQCVIAMEHLRTEGKIEAFDLGWAQLFERMDSMEYDFLTMVDENMPPERRAIVKPTSKEAEEVEQ